MDIMVWNLKMKFIIYKKHTNIHILSLKLFFLTIAPPTTFFSLGKTLNRIQSHGFQVNSSHSVLFGQSRSLIGQFTFPMGSTPISLVAFCSCWNQQVSIHSPKYNGTNTLHMQTYSVILHIYYRCILLIWRIRAGLVPQSTLNKPINTRFIHYYTCFNQSKTSIEC